MVSAHLLLCQVCDFSPVVSSLLRKCQIREHFRFLDYQCLTSILISIPHINFKRKKKKSQFSTSAANVFLSIRYVRK